MVWAALASALPLSETFNGVFPPAGWLSFQSGNGTQTWTRSPTAPAGWLYSAYSRKETLPVGQVSRRWLVSPPIFPQGADSVLRFFTRTQTPALPADTTDDTLCVKLSFGGTSASSFTETLLRLKPGIGGDFGATFVEYRINLTPYAGQVVRIAWQTIDPDFADHNLYVDSVSGPQIPTTPGAPLLLTPANGATDIGVLPTLTWQLGAWTSHVDLYLSTLAGEVSSLSANARVYSGLAQTNYVPPLSLLSDSTYYWRVVGRNALGQSVGSQWSFTTALGPLQGIYAVGPTGQFASLSEVLTLLETLGMSGPTEIAVQPGVYNERLTIPALVGASSSSPLTITSSDTAQPALFQVNNSADSCIVLFAQAQHVNLEYLQFKLGSSAIHQGIRIADSSQSIAIRHCRVEGISAADTAGNGVYISGVGLSNIVLDALDISRFADGIEAVSTDLSADVRIENCEMDTVRRGIVLTKLAHSELLHNDIVPNAGSVEDVSAIHIGTTYPGDSVLVDGNKLHGMTTSGPFAYGIRIRPDSMAAIIEIRNNFVYDFRTTGAAQVRGISVIAGHCRLVGNTIDMNDAASSGPSYALYVGNTPAGSSLTLWNNILSNREAAATAYSIFLLNPLVTLSSDYNVFYGTGANYRLGRRVHDASSLGAWQNLTGLDAASLEGNPGFVADLDPHLSPSGSSLAHQNGLYVSDLRTDVDGELRRIPPDRGADEFEYLAPTADFALISLPNLPTQFEVGRTYELRAVVLNRGSAAQIGVPVTWYFGAAVLGTDLLSLAPLELDTLSFFWVTGQDTSSGLLSCRVALPADADPGNDSLGVSVSIANVPMSGIYHIGPGGDYETISQAVADAFARGVAGATEFHLTASSFEEIVVIPAIPGLSGSATLTLRPDPNYEGMVSLRSESAPATIVFDNADFVRVENLTVEALGANPVAILIQNGSQQVHIVNCNIFGSTPLSSTTYGVRVLGGGNHNLVIDGCALAHAYRGIRVEGSITLSDTAVNLTRCTISGCRTGIRLDYQSGARIADCWLTAGYDSAATTCIGVSINALQAGQTVLLERNRFTSIPVAGAVYGIYENAVSGSAAIRNNMFYNLQAQGSGDATAICVLSGSADIDFNSMLFAAIASTGAQYGVKDSSSAPVVVRNNIFRTTDPTHAVWYLAQFGSALQSDHNLFDNSTGGSSLFSIGRIGGVSYPSLAQWQSASGQDLQSIAGVAGFVATTDLHLITTSAAASGAGVYLPNIPYDFDGELRDTSPDIGCDEYAYLGLQRDFSAAFCADVPSVFHSDSLQTVSVVVYNFGLDSQVDVPIQLLFNGEIIGQLIISLTAQTQDTFQFVWTPPLTQLLNGALEVRSVLTGDELASNDRMELPITVAGEPLAGAYQIGGQNPNFGGISELALHLNLRGVSGAVDVVIYPGIYYDAAQFTSIPGSGPLAPVTIRALDQQAHPQWTYPGDAELLVISGAAYLNFQDLDLYGTAGGAAVVRLEGGSDHITLQRCVVHGTDSLSSYFSGIAIEDGCDSNEVSECIVHGAFTGIALNGAGSLSVGNRIVDNHIVNARYGISVLRQAEALIDHNDIEGGFPTGFVAPCYGIYIGNLGTNGSVIVNGNTLHRFSDHSTSTTNRAVGIYSAPTGSALATLSNNVIYGFEDIVNLKINGIYLSAGINRVFNNSVMIGNSSDVNEVVCVYISNGSNHTLMNNILVSRETDVSSYGILHATGEGLISDYNDIYGTSPVFVTGRLGSVTYAQLPQWQAAAFDLHSIAAEPGFVSDSNLHIRSDVSAVDGRGVVLADVGQDIDGDVRGTPPDLGADEYDVISLADPVADLTSMLTANGLELRWSATPGAQSYHVYASAAADTVFAPENLLDTVAGTFYLLPLSGLSSVRYFVVTADTNPIP